MARTRRNHLRRLLSSPNTTGRSQQAKRSFPWQRLIYLIDMVAYDVTATSCCSIRFIATAYPATCRSSSFSKGGAGIVTETGLRELPGRVGFRHGSALLPPASLPAADHPASAPDRPF